MMRKAFFLAMALVAAAWSGRAWAQLGGLGLPQPQLPGVGNVVGDLTGAADRAGASLSPDALRGQRRLQIRGLLRDYPRVLEADPHGDPIVRSKILAIAPDAAALAHAQALHFEIARSDELEGVGAMVTLRAPAGMSTRAALRALRQADPQGVYDYDHINIQSGAAAATPQTVQPETQSGGRIRVGLVDGGVGAHPSLDGAIAAQRAFSGDAVVASAHATAVASLLAGHGGGVEGAAPGAQIYVADIYGGAPTGGSSAALARALSWLAGERTPVINVSLVGPRNRIVETVVAALVSRGFLIVAAVGNDGPAAPPLYPAAYPGVVGVTGVDTHERVLVEAERGPQVDFAAPGTPIAALGPGAGRVRGTSFAAPIAAGLLALQASAISPEAAERALSVLRSRAIDLGPRGRDNIYGDGLVGAASLTARSP